MSKKEIQLLEKEYAEKELDIYAGILCNNVFFETGNFEEIQYGFDCEEWKELKEKYKLEDIAKTGSSFRKAKRLLQYFSSRLEHNSWYDNHIECNALALLEYSLNNKEQGINCLNKSKILEECCLALHIYARRVCLMPYSPYDFDNHVVVEIYDEKMKKWIMLDPSTNGYFVDQMKMPLSVLEMRDKFAKDEFLTFVSCKDSLKDLKKLREKNMEYNAYFCKNLFYFNIDQDSVFGQTDRILTFVPLHYQIKKQKIANLKYRIHHLPKEYKGVEGELEKKLEKLSQQKEEEPTSIESMIKSPIRKGVK